jgi:hypothetical protein
MLSPETLERYRRMTPGERLKLTLQMTRDNSPFLFQGDPELVERRFQLLRRQNDERNQAMLETLARAEKRHEGR